MSRSAARYVHYGVTAPIRLAGTVVALVASVVLLVLPSAERKVPAVPVPAGQAWPGARRASLSPTLADGSAYQPALFLDANTSVGSALKGASVRLVVRRADGSVRTVRELAQKDFPSFPAVAAAGDVLVWVERTNRSPAALWTAGLRDGRPRRITGDVG